MSLTLLSCKKKQNIFQIDDKEELVIESTSIGCFHSKYYLTRIVRNGNKYITSFNELINPDKDLPIREYFKEHKLKETVWNQKDLETFLQTLKTDTSSVSTTNIHHILINKNDTITFWESTGSSRLLSSYY